MAKNVQLTLKRNVHFYIGKKVLADKLEVPDGKGCATRIIRFTPLLPSY